MGRTADLDKELKRIEQGEAWKESDEVVRVEVKRPLDKVIPVRLAAADWARMRELAREIGVGPSTLARMWLLERLRLRYELPRDASKTPELVRDAPEERLVTSTEKQVLEYVARGYLSEQIAEKLGVSKDTVRDHLRRILRKLNARREQGLYQKSKHRA